MENKDLNEVVIKDEEGKEYLMKILFTYHNDNRDADYVFAYDPNDEESIYILKYGENDEIVEVVDEDELDEAQEVFDAFMEDPKIQSIK